jgi:hypothetical protein
MLSASYGVALGADFADRGRLALGLKGRHLYLGTMLGLFGRNEPGLGLDARLGLGGESYETFVRGALTASIAHQDSSSSAEFRVPVGVEAGVGVSLPWNKAGETGGSATAMLSARAARGGYSEDETLSPAHVNQSFALALDIAVSWSWPL